MTYWTAAYTQVNAERKARDAIEAQDRGTFIPTFAKIYYLNGRKKEFERPILSRYILVALEGRDDDDGLSAVMNAEGVQGVFCTYHLDHKGLPVARAIRVPDKEVERLMMLHVTGALNSIQHRNAAGRFAKPRRRRCRPRKGKKASNLTYIRGANQDDMQQAS